MLASDGGHTDIVQLLLSSAGAKIDLQNKVRHDINLSLVGASLSEPHTSVTSLHTCVCMLACLLAWTDQLTKNFK